MALTMFDRARWTNKLREADVFRHWLMDRLGDMDTTPAGGGTTALAKKG